MLDQPIKRRDFIGGAMAASSGLILSERLLGGSMQSTPLAFSILHTNDMHSNFLGLGPVMDYTPERSNPDDHTVGGYARLATLIQERKRALEALGPVLILDAGDFTMGTALGAACRQTGAELRMLAQLGYDDDHQGVKGSLAFLRDEQEAEGSWFGRWGTNYIYGTWSVLSALNAAGVDPAAPEIRRAVDFLLAHQRDDGGWGEDGASYWPDQPHGEGKVATASQTAWALLALMAAGEVGHPAVARGIRYLVEAQAADGLWEEASYTAVGFPRVFYLRYHGYRAFFPLWALARYRNLQTSNTTRPAFGI